MKQKEFSYSMPVFLVLLIVMIWAAMGIFKEPEAPELIKVSVVVEDSNNPKWTPFKLGLETAAKEANVDLTIVSTSVWDSVKEQWSLIDQKKTDGAEGIIVAPFDETGTDAYYEPLSWEVALCMVKTGVDKGTDIKNAQTAIPDYNDLTKLIMSQIKADYGRTLNGQRVILLTCHYHDQEVSYIMDQLEESLKAEGCTIAGKSKTQDSINQVWKMKRKQDIVIALDDDSLLIAAQKLNQETEKGCKLYGLGVSESCIYYLDKSIISGMVVTDDFNMGYESLLSVAKRVRNKYGDSEPLSVEAFSIRPDDVHNPEIEKRLFPVIQ